MHRSLLLRSIVSYFFGPVLSFCAPVTFKITCDHTPGNGSDGSPVQQCACGMAAQPSTPTDAGGPAQHATGTEIQLMSHLLYRPAPTELPVSPVTPATPGIIEYTPLLARPQVRGKFIYVCDRKLYLRGVTYGTFRPDDRGDQYPSPDLVERDFAQMAANGINVMRTYTLPPLWLRCRPPA